MELTGNHLKAARALAGLDQETLADLAGVSVNTIRNMEAVGNDAIGGRQSSRDKVQAALEGLGIEFMNGGEPGVRLRGRHGVRAKGKSSEIAAGERAAIRPAAKKPLHPPSRGRKKR